MYFIWCLQAVMEEADIRSAEVKKSSYEFERDIVKGAVNQVNNPPVKFTCWELNFVFLCNFCRKKNCIVLYCHPTWPRHQVVENQEYSVHALESIEQSLLICCKPDT